MILWASPNAPAWGLNLGGGIGGLLKLWQGGHDYAYLYDGRGNVTALIDGAQSVAAAYSYDPFGVLVKKSGTLDQPFIFSTKEYDAGTGQYYYGYRFYAPGLAKWTTKDPLEEAGGVNLYEFVGNNAVNWSDPLGLTVYVCSQPAFGKMPVDHQWIKTDSKEAGMGGARGNVPGNQSGDKPGDPVQVTDHSGRSREPGASCEEVPFVDEDLVNDQLQIGRSLGDWTPNNNCQTFVRDVINNSRKTPNNTSVGSKPWKGWTTGGW